MTTDEDEGIRPGFDSLGHAWRVFANTQEMIRYADQKVHVLIVLSTLFVTAFLANLAAITHTTGWVAAVVWLFAGATLLFLVFALGALFSRSDAKTGEAVPKLIYFGHVAAKAEASEYAQEFRELTSETALADVCYQIYEVSAIASKKFWYYQMSWIFLLIQAMSLLTLLVCVSADV